ncbi:DNA-binding transcriptional regulator, LysR family [Paracoccus halophilus]|uniref:DNA-binding transcriptional regulator, LysR family n=1 Tax=Paracoccus halophilus TaxID=376733 RepID=A0A099F8T8_9RHOB|nr:LysR family transcriptional regulator [Paracoccus halophilus]KGJ06651.1 hypothetical protein IT41_00245 [Paracoccus halophilus]SFA42438.1 DNA-binding transcriptional regulator, LysR family [Paracoccus halophilus]
MPKPVPRHERLEIREIVAIDSVARARSFKIAADMTHSTQPTLSRLIASAEGKLGVTLFRRGWSGADTTSRGDMAVRLCAAILREIDAAGDKLFADRPSLPALRLNLRNAHLQAVEAVTREGSVTLAAKRLGRSQPELSRTLSDFSKRFGVELFRRNPTGMEPLPPAAILTELSGSISYLMENLRREFSRLDGEVIGRVAIGMLPFSGQDLISRAFARLTNRHPNIRLACIPGSYNGLAEALRRREIDRIIGIMRGADCPHGMEETHLYDERFTVVARQGHPLQGSRATPSELAETQWVIAPHGTPVRAHFESVFAGLGVVPPTQSCEMLSFNAAEQMIIESNSLAMLTYSPHKLRHLRPELCRIDTPFPSDVARIGLTRLRDGATEAALVMFEESLADVVAEIA